MAAQMASQTAAQTVVVIDYGMGNIRSVARALVAAAPDARVMISDDPVVINHADRVVFPGQGAMPDCMKALHESGLGDAVRNAAASKPFFGVCVGMQMLFERSSEGDTPGLGLLKGRVVKFDFGANPDRLKVPHMGWNEVWQRPLATASNNPGEAAVHPLFAGVADGQRFYHVHSYYAADIEPSVLAAETAYPNRFTSAVAQNNLFGTQFHPEKSGAPGLQVYRNFMNWRL